VSKFIIYVMDKDDIDSDDQCQMVATDVLYRLTKIHVGLNSGNEPAEYSDESDLIANEFEILVSAIFRLLTHCHGHWTQENQIEEWVVSLVRSKRHGKNLRMVLQTAVQIPTYESCEDAKRRSILLNLLREVSHCETEKSLEVEEEDEKGLLEHDPWQWYLDDVMFGDIERLSRDGEE
jgi:hypothetical protein